MANRKKKRPPKQADKWIHSIQAGFNLKPGEKSVVQELNEERRAGKAQENRLV